MSPNGQATPVVFGTPTVAGGVSPISTTCTPVSGSLFSIGTTPVTCTATDAQQRASTCSFAVNVQAPARIRLTKFLAFGDSITLGEDGNTLTQAPPGVQPFVLFDQTYPDVLRRQLSTRYTTQAMSVDNRGMPGEMVGTPEALTRFSQLVATRAYEAVLIMEGTNDLFTVDPRLITPAIANLRAMVRDARSRNVRPYLATIPPMNPAGRRGGGANLVAPLNEEIRALARAEGVTLVDIQLAFGTSFSLLSNDGLHPNAEGFTRIAETFFAALRSTLELPAAAAIGGPAALTRPSWP